MPLSQAVETPIRPPPGYQDKGPILPETFLINLRQSIDWARRQLMPAVQKGLDIIRQIVGMHYGTTGARERVLMPFLRLQNYILARNLVSRNPRVLIETNDPSLRAAAKQFELWFAERSECMDLEHILYRWVLGALVYPFSLVEVCSGTTSAHDGFPDLGYPYVDVVDFERCVVDMAAKSWRHMDYLGHRYTVSKDVMLEPDSGYDHRRVRQLTPDPYLQLNELGFEKTETLSQDTPFSYVRMRDYIDVWKIYLPKEGVLVHLPLQGNVIDHRPILTEPYVGMQGRDRTGPFHRLTFEEVIGNIFGTPPLHATYDLHLAINKLSRKAVRQADRQKTNLLVQSTVVQDAEKVRKAGDGDVIPVSSPQAFQETRLGGPDQQNMAFFLALKQLANLFGGNFFEQGGLAEGAKTLGQEKIQAANSSQAVDFMQKELTTRSAELCRSILWYEWNSRRTQQTNVPIPGMPGQSVPSQLTPEDRDIEGFYRLQFSIHPYSMGPVTPQQRSQQWMQLFQGVILPSMGLMAQQGAAFNVISFAKKMADYLGLQDLDEVLKVNPVDPMQTPDQTPPNDQGPRVRPPGTGEYTRTNEGGGQEGQDQEIMDAMKQGDARQQGT